MTDSTPSMNYPNQCPTRLILERGKKKQGSAQQRTRKVKQLLSLVGNGRIILIYTKKHVH